MSASFRADPGDEGIRTLTKQSWGGREHYTHVSMQVMHKGEVTGLHKIREEVCQADPVKCSDTTGDPQRPQSCYLYPI